jgi:hypothetical protein
LVLDLPGMRPVPVPTPQNTSGKVKAGPPGLRSFRPCQELQTNRALAFREAIQDILPAMVAAGYDVIGRIENELLVFERQDERVVLPSTRAAVAERAWEGGRGMDETHHMTALGVGATTAHVMATIALRAQPVPATRHDGRAWSRFYSI